MGFEILKTIFEAGNNVVDISFFGEDAFKLDDLAKEKGVTAIVDLGTIMKLKPPLWLKLQNIHAQSSLAK